MILISNDDSINAKGIAALVEVAKQFDEKILVVAPDSPQSAKSHSITLGKPLTYQKNNIFGKDIEAYALSGTPADCIKFAINILLKEKPNLVLSGINHGGNFSVNLIYSGTVAAVVEAAMHKIPAIAFSVDDHSPDLDFDAAKHYAKIIIEKMLKMKNETYCLNVNLPYITKEQIKGIKICKQTSGVWFEEFEPVQVDHSPLPHFLLTGRYHNYEPQSVNTDVWAIENGYVAIVPIQTDLTDYEKLQKLSNINF